MCIGMDYNANINWLVVGQPSGKRLNIVKSFYVKFERKLPELVADFCAYYATHQNKTVVFYYESTALGGNYAVSDQDFRWVIIHEFERHGWRVEDVYLGNPMRHDEKYLLINQGFAGKQRLMPFFNRQNNDDLILAIQAAGVSRGRLRIPQGQSPVKNSPKPKKTALNTAPTAPTLSTPSISAARNFPILNPHHSTSAELFNQIQLIFSSSSNILSCSLPSSSSMASFFSFGILVLASISL